MMSILVQQYSRNSLHMLLNLGNYFWRSPGSVGINSLETHRRAPAVFASPVARLAWDAQSLAMYCPELSFDHSISALERPSLRTTPQHTYMSCMHDLAIKNKDNHDTTACFGSVSKEATLSLGADWLAYTYSGPPEPKIIYRAPLGPALANDATPRKCSVLGGASPRRGNGSGFWRTFEKQGRGARVTRRARTAAPRLRSTPPTSTRSLVSRRHKSRGYPRSRTGLQCRQFIVLEGARRPLIKVYIGVYNYIRVCIYVFFLALRHFFSSGRGSFFVLSAPWHAGVLPESHGASVGSGQRPCTCPGVKVASPHGEAFRARRAIQAPANPCTA